MLRGEELNLKFDFEKGFPAAWRVKEQNSSQNLLMGSVHVKQRIQNLLESGNEYLISKRSKLSYK